jgi:DNA replication protein DnaC
VANETHPSIAFPARTPKSFDGFVSGATNQDALRAAQDFARNVHRSSPSRLVLLGPSGTGKTHLLRAIHARIQAERAEIAIAFWTMSEMADLLIAGIKADRPGRVQDAGMALDLLVIDDCCRSPHKSATFRELALILSSINRRGVSVAVGGTDSPWTTTYATHHLQTVGAGAWR